MKKFLLAFSFIWMMSCTQDQQTTKELSIYFDLDSLLDAQISALTQGNYQLQKMVQLDDEREDRTWQPDSSEWSKEFSIIRDFNLNKAYYVGSYEKSATENGFRYQLADQIDAPVSYFKVEKSDGSISRITSDYLEDKTIYQHKRQLDISFENGLISTYSISGFQDMIFKDSIQYTISAEIISP